MTHQGEHSVFQAAMWRADREASQSKAAGERATARAELTGAPLRPCRLEGRLYE